MAIKKSGRTGPTSIPGKKRSSMNALKHGAYSQAVVLPSEDAHDYERKVRAYQRTLKMTTELGKDLARLTVDHYWVAQRLKTQLVIAEKKYYPRVEPIEFAKYLGIPNHLAQKAPDFLVNASYEVPSDVRDHALTICEQITFLKFKSPWQGSYEEFCKTCPELKAVLEDYLEAKELAPLLGDGYFEESGWVWNRGALNTWNLDAIYANYFYEANFDVYKAQLRIYMEMKHLQNLSLAYPKELSTLEVMAQRSQKELNAMRSSLQLAINYGKLERAQVEQDRECKKKRNEMPDSRSGSIT